MTRHSLDLLGEICPVPLSRTQAAVADLTPGTELLVETDFARAVRNITHWCSRHGHSYQIFEVRDGVWQVLICKR